jgi:hypothetical protein
MRPHRSERSPIPVRTAVPGHARSRREPKIARVGLALLLTITWLTAVPTAVQRVSAAGDPTIAAAGDIACDPLDSNFNGGVGTGIYCMQQATADLLVGHGYSAVLSLGDNQYYCGSLSAYQQVYDNTWGQLKSITHPVTGNHEYLTQGGSEPATGCDQSNLGGAGYFGYFGSAAGTAGQGWYSFDIGAWHLIALNSNCTDAGGCGPSSPQGKWLAADLAAHPNQCTLAYWHIPLFSSGGRANSNSQAFWNALYAAHVDLILNGHDHIYERFAPQAPDGTADPVNGITQITVGTGGANHTSIAAVAPNSLVINTDSFGVLALTLHPSSFSWSFQHATGTFTDSGTTSCHAAGGGNPTPTATARPTPTPTPSPSPSPTAKPAGVPDGPTGIAAVAGNASATVSWLAPPDNGSPIARYTVTSSPGSRTCQTTTTSCAVSGLTNGIPYTFTVTATNGVGQGPPSAHSTPVIPLAGATYIPLTPTRLLDTRISLGLSGALRSHVARAFQVTGAVVPAGAVAVTGNLTVTGQTALGFLYLGPNAANDPTSSTLNFPAGDDRANAVTVALGTGGTLSITYASPSAAATAHAVFDVTGYFLADATGSTYMPVSPTRLLDSRYGTGFAGPIGSRSARTFQVTGSVVPSGAVAVTGNLTVTGQTADGYLYLGPNAINDPTSSTLNFPAHDDRANAVTVALGPGGTLSVTFASPVAGATTHVIFDVTGYFVSSLSGATYQPLTPTRLVDSRYGEGLAVALSSHQARSFAVTGSTVPSRATAVTGNLTVTGQQSLGFLYLGPNAANDPTSSTLNFPAGDDRANAVSVSLSGDGKLWVTYAAPTLGPTAQVVFDVTGYFAP